MWNEIDGNNVRHIIFYNNGTWNFWLHNQTRGLKKKLGMVGFQCFLSEQTNTTTRILYIYIYKKPTRRQRPNKGKKIIVIVFISSWFFWRQI